MAAIRDGYRPPAGTYDELMAPDGAVRPHWVRFVRSLQALAPAQLAERWSKVERLLYENGITYNVHIDGEGTDRPWELDAVPFLIAPDDWRALEAGLIQRARLLNTILADLYGPQRLLRDGSLPAALVFGNPQFLRPCHGIAPRDGTYLHFYAVDLGRGPDGRWWVLSDRCEAPEGVGFALENRIVLSHCFREEFRDNQVHRLAGFFQAMHERLVALSGRDDPRIVLLTPGPLEPSYFAHAYLARYLGYTLAEGGDLMARDSRVYLKTLDGLQPVDLILRRMPGEDCDPLELRGDSLLGVPGLVETARAGNVVIANALGSGLVESAAITPFLPGLCRHLLGEDLRLPTIATWWCGQPGPRDHVAANLDRLLVRPAFARRSLLGRARAPQPFEGDRDALVQRLMARGYDYIGQEPATLSTAPVWSDGRLGPAPMTLRVFVSAVADGYSVMPGGLARVSGADDPVDAGAGSKDTWVLSDRPVSAFSRLPAQLTAVALRRTGKDLPSRAADNLFWLGRYAERAEGTMRLLRSVIVRLTEDSRPMNDLAALERVLAPLLAKAHLATGSDGGTVAERTAVLRRQLATLMYGVGCPYGIVESLGHLHRTAALVRDRLSLDAWRILSELQPDRYGRLWGSSEGAAETDLGYAQEALDQGIRALAAFSGMEMENMTRSHGWRFLDMGRRIERGVHMIEALQGLLGAENLEEDGSLVLLLDIADSFMTYRSRYLTTPLLAPVLDLLLMDETNPRSVGFQIAALARHIEQLPRDRDRPERSAEQRIVMATLTELRLSDISALCKRSRRGRRTRLHVLLDTLAKAMPELSEVISRAYFSHAEDAGTALSLQRPGPAA